jgi:hypothetical protein
MPLPQLVIINVLISKVHLKVSCIKYIKVSIYNCIKFGTEISILQIVKFINISRE